jgi:hypothetical protein
MVLQLFSRAERNCLQCFRKPGFIAGKAFHFYTRNTRNAIKNTDYQVFNYL